MKVLQCITQIDCFWCVHDDNSHSCFKADESYGKKCKNRIFYRDYLTNPQTIKQSIMLNEFNDNLEALASNQILDKNSKNIDENSKDLPPSPHSESFMRQLKLFFNANKKRKLTLFDSIENPSGAFQYQLSSVTAPSSEALKGKSFEMIQDFNLAMLNKLSKRAKIQFLYLSKLGAYNMLKKMFKFTTQSIEKTKFFRGPKYYLYLEKMAQDKWVSYLEKFDCVERIKIRKIIIDKVLF